MPKPFIKYKSQQLSVQQDIFILPTTSTLPMPSYWYHAKRRHRQICNTAFVAYEYIYAPMTNITAWRIMFEKMQGIYFYSLQRVILSFRKLMVCTEIPGDVMWSLVVNKVDYVLKPCGWGTLGLKIRFCHSVCTVYCVIHEHLCGDDVHK